MMVGDPGGGGRFGGDSFGGGAARLAGIAGAVLGWPPDVFWAATPADLAIAVGALIDGRGTGEQAMTPPDAAAIARMREAFPDG